MSEPRTMFLDYDARNTPKTPRFCIKCQRDIRADRPARRVWLVEGEPTVIHPDDVGAAALAGADVNEWLIGMDCAAMVGMEWTQPEVTTDRKPPEGGA